MKTNLNSTDRIIRAIIGLIFIYLGYSNIGAISWIAYILGIGFLITAIIGFCSVYKLLDISTKKDSPIIPAQPKKQASPVAQQPQPISAQPNPPASGPPSDTPPQSPQWPTS